MQYGRQHRANRKAAILLVGKRIPSGRQQWPTHFCAIHLQVASGVRGQLNVRFRGRPRVAFEDPFGYVIARKNDSD
jgi:hypothetical protein